MFSPNQFLDLGNRSAVGVALHRLVKAGKIRRIRRGLYDLPRSNPIIGQTPFGVQPYPFNPYIGQTVPQLGQIGSPYGQITPQFGQIGLPYGQITPQFGQIGLPYGQIGSVLAPQSWVGQPGLYGSHPLSQVHPLVSQLIGRGFGGAGVFPPSL